MIRSETIFHLLPKDSPLMELHWETISSASSVRNGTPSVCDLAAKPSFHLKQNLCCEQIKAHLYKKSLTRFLCACTFHANCV